MANIFPVRLDAGGLFRLSSGWQHATIKNSWFEIDFDEAYGGLQ
jgi:hypothetical protein